MIYGATPEDLGLMDLAPVEFMYWLYCPIWTPREGLTLPPNLRQFEPLVRASCLREQAGALATYGYLTAKTLWVSGDYTGNRPGWHTDGFGTEDINYIWSDRAPTEFYNGTEFDLADDCADAMAEMERRAIGGGERWITTYPDKHLLRLTPAVVHRPPVGFAPGMRTFFKLSISKDRYNLEGNSINHGLTERWPMVPRGLERNHPSAPTHGMNPHPQGKPK